MQVIGVVLLVVLAVGFMIGLAAGDAFNSVSNRSLHRQLAAYEKAEQQAKALRQQNRARVLSAPAKKAPSVVPSQQKHSAWATRPPIGEFSSFCECPDCGWLDTHFLRPARPASAPQPVPEKSWWEEALGWFTDDEPDAETEPTADHSKVGVVRTCTKCGYVWGQA